MKVNVQEKHVSVLMDVKKIDPCLILFLSITYELAATH